MKKTDFILFCLMLIISFLSLMLSNEQAKQYGYLLYISISMTIFIALAKEKKMVVFFSPAILTLVYILLSFAIGSFAFSKGLVMLKTDYNMYLGWEKTNFSTFFILFSSTCIYFIDSFFRPYYINAVEKVNNLNSNKVKYFTIIFLFFAALFSFVPLDMSFMGSLGDMSIIPKSIAAISVAYFMNTKKYFFRFIVYFIIIGIFSITSFENKREAIFLIFSMLLLESVFYTQKFNLKIIVNMLLIAIVLSFFIIVMSIARGYGGFEGVTNVFNAIPYVLEYINTELFWVYFLNNIEVNYTFYNSMQAIEYVQKDWSLLSYGSTVIKAFFIFIPREIYEAKPQSIIDLYTTYHNPVYRTIGGSAPINLFSEFFWNFGFFSFIALSFLYLILSYIFWKMISCLKQNKIAPSVLFLYAYQDFLVYVRGSGLDMYLVNILIATAFMVGATMIIQLLQARLYTKNGDEFRKAD